MNFTAIDFETINGNRGICQVGIVCVREGEIVDRFSSLCSPVPGVEPNPFSMRKHGISPSSIREARPFAEVWSEIRSMIDGCVVVAHNLSFDLSALNNDLLSIGQQPASPKELFCTLNFFGGSGTLSVLCEAFDIPLQHHDAASDAEAAARLYLLIQQEDPRVKTLKTILAPSLSSTVSPHRERVLKGEILRKDLSKADPSNPFFDRKVVITGFSAHDKKAIAERLHALGADIDTGISARTEIVCIGSSPGPAKMAKVEKLQADGVNIDVIDNIIEVLGL